MILTYKQIKKFVFKNKLILVLLGLSLVMIIFGYQVAVWQKSTEHSADTLSVQDVEYPNHQTVTLQPNPTPVYLAADGKITWTNNSSKDIHIEVTPISNTYELPNVILVNANSEITTQYFYVGDYNYGYEIDSNEYSADLKIR